MNERNEQALRDLARRYVEEQGKSLLAEREWLERQGAAAPPTLKKRVVSRLGAPRRKRVVAVATALAACIALMMLVQQFVERSPGTAGVGAPDRGSADGGAPMENAEAAPEEAAAGEADAAAEADGEETPEPPESGGGEPEDVITGGSGMIELQLDLPVHFAVVDIDQDDDKTVYYIDNERLDDVVLSVQYRVEPLDTDGMEPLRIHGVDAWAQRGPDYQLLTFEYEEIVYVLTCRYELDTLIELAEYIIPAGM